MSFITLLTDFGLKDGYPGVMKGVIYQIAPHAQIVDITHQIQPQNILAGEIVLERSYRYFPAGSIHVAVVDPGVGTRRRPIAARLGEHLFVCPDNGLITLALEEAEKAGQRVEMVHLNQPRFWLAQVSTVFHGRDIFAPVAGHLAAGVALTELGDYIHDPVRLSIPAPQPIKDGWRGQVMDVDHFGNLIINIQDTDLSRMGAVEIQIAGERIQGLARTFGDGRPGDLVALIDSDNRLSICVVNGSAAERLSASAGTPVEVFSI